MYLQTQLAKWTLRIALLPVMIGWAASGAQAAGPDRTALFPELEHATAVVEGVKDDKAAKARLYVMFDANCLYCNLTWRAVQPYERIGLQVRWVPVAYQKDTSFTRAAAILNARDPAAALRENETGYNADSYDGAIKPAASITPALRAQLDANTALMKKLGVPATPALVWKDKAGKVNVSAGVPKERELAAMTGLPLQKYSDPKLAEFR